MLSNFYTKNHRVYLIQDNASYHKKTETYEWFKKNRKYIEVFCLPPYLPELNATERIWQYTRKNSTHNKYFETKEELINALDKNFCEIQQNPELIMGLLKPFF